MEGYKVKITIVKKLNVRDIYGDNPPFQIAEGSSGECDEMGNVGDEFVVLENGVCPAGFCNWAFVDLHRVYVHLRYGGNFPFTEEGVKFACCTSGRFPVLFKLERME